jgi:hypothetical protein
MDESLMLDLVSEIERLRTEWVDNGSGLHDERLQQLMGLVLLASIPIGWPRFDGKPVCFKAFEPLKRLE